MITLRFVAVALLLSACSDAEGVSCTLQGKFPIRVHVASMYGLEPESVVAKRLAEVPCQRQVVASDAGVREYYSCSEQGGGTYTVRVTSGTLSWTQQANIAADACGTTEVKDLHFELEPGSAD